MKNFYIKSLFLLLTLLSFFGTATAQTATCIDANLELAAASATVGTRTVQPQTAILLNNTTGTTFVATSPIVSATMSISNQQYTANSAYAAPNNVGTFFGAAAGTGSPTYDNLGAIGNSNNANFTSNATATPGTGIDINSNFGFRMFWSTVPLAGQPTTGRYQYSDITITFSTPVDNPIMHVADFGGFNSQAFQSTTYFSSEYELLTPGLTLSLLSSDVNGPTLTLVDNGPSVTNGTYINTVTNAANSFQDASFRVNGLGVTSITFRTYIQGNGGTTSWDTFTTSGEALVFSFSIPDQVPTAPVPTATTVTNNCPLTTFDLTGVQPADIAGQTYEWHTVAGNPTGADLVAAPSGVTGAGPFYLYAKNDLTGCYSPASTPITTTQTLCPLSTCTDMPAIWAAPNSTLNVNGVNVTLSQGFVGTAGGSLPGQGSPVAGFLNTSAIGTTNSSTVDNNSAWTNYIWIRLHFDQPTTVQSPFKFLDIDGFTGANAELATIIGQNGSTIVTPTITNGSSVTAFSIATTNDPTGINLGNVTAYRSTGNYESVTDDPRNLIVADFSAQPVTDVYFMYGVFAASSGNTGAQYSAISSTCLEMAIPSANTACTSPPYKLYKYNRVSTGWASNLPVEIVGATTTNVTLDERTNGTDLNFEGVDWKLVASDIVPNANGEINVTLKPVVGTTNGSFIVADAMMLSNGFTNTIIDAGNLDFSTTGAGWTPQNFAGSFLGDEVFWPQIHIMEELQPGLLKICKLQLLHLLRNFYLHQ